MATDTRIARGRLGERIAAEHLTRSGYRIVERNFRTRAGELDLVAEDARSLVFCEVKTRIAGGRSGPPSALEGVGPSKRRQVRRMAGQWLAARSAGRRHRRRELRFDAIGITLTPAGELVALEHLEGAY